MWMKASTTVVDGPNVSRGSSGIGAPVESVVWPAAVMTSAPICPAPPAGGACVGVGDGALGVGDGCAVGVAVRVGARGVAVDEGVARPVGDGVARPVGDAAATLFVALGAGGTLVLVAVAVAGARAAAVVVLA